jgi:hypothetical protein
MEECFDCQRSLRSRNLDPHQNETESVSFEEMGIV